jgi:amino acid adenylation domain-containing protein
MLRPFLDALTPSDLIGLAALRCMVSSGEALPSDLVARFAAAFPGGRVALHNQWGLTEVSIDSTIWTCDPVRDARGGPVPIGYAIDNNSVHILDAGLNPVPQGATGEIYLGGVGLARGYLGDSATTARTFVASPFRAGERMYRTGDLGFRREDGAIVFLGRADRQVKIRGIRVDPAETESVLREHPGVADAVVVAADGTRLVGYVVGSADLEAELRERLDDRLPAVLRPAVYVFLPALPLITSGKVDRRALPPPPAEPSVADDPPRTATEETLARVWAEILGVPSIGVHRNFFDAGGHSISAATAAVRMSALFGLEIRVAELWEHPTVADMATAVDAWRARGRAPIPRTPAMGPTPLSPVQERLLVLTELDTRPGIHLCREALRLRGPLDEEALRQAFERVVAVHEAFRAVVGFDGQRPTEPGEFRFTPLPERMSAASGPLLAADLCRLGPDDHLLTVAFHHLVYDDQSSGIFWSDLGSAYRALSTGTVAEIPAPAARYADYAAWWRNQLAENEAGQARYWREQLAGLERIALPRDRPWAAPGPGAAVSRDVPAEVTASLRALAASTGTTLFTALLTAFQVLLGRYAGTTDVATGIFVSDRPHPDLDRVIGFFTNTLVVRTDLSGSPSLAGLMTGVQRTVAAARRHADLPYDRVVTGQRPVREDVRDPLLAAAFAFERVPDDPWGLPGLVTAREDPPETAPRFDLWLSVREQAENLTLTFIYDTGLFNAATVARIAAQYSDLLAELDPAAPIEALGQAAPAGDSGASQLAGPRPEPVHELFHRIAARLPDALAVSGASGDLTYRELARAVSGLAQRLRTDHGVGPETTVGVYAHRDTTLVVALLGILSAGGAYLPLDADAPPARLAVILDDASPAVIVTDRDDVPWTGAPVIRIEGAAAAAPPALVTVPDQVAYTIHTSGSTGRPKGVQVTHGGLANFARTLRRWLAPGDRVLATTTVAFDIAAVELLVPLTVGASVVVATREDAVDGHRLAELIDVHEIDVLQATPSGWRLLLDSGWAGRPLRALCGGEALDRALATRIAERTGALTNLYGPTETTVYSTAAEVDGSVLAEGAPPIGVPLDATAVRVLDGRLRPVPPGVVGELYIGGAGVARGYLGRPGLTSTRFVADPFGAGDRLYRTGDLVRRRADGALDFVGRTDQQVKIRGHRVELGDVEAALGAIPGVAACAVLADATPVAASLFAYAVTELSEETLRGLLLERIPRYMIPSRIVPLDALPMTPNDKIDRRALPPPAPPVAQGRPAAPGRERIVADVLAEVLGIGEMAADQGFFLLGGDSLLAVRALTRLRELHGFELSFREFVTDPTAAGIAALARSADAVGSPVRATGGPVPLSDGQLRLWFLHQLNPDRGDYHMPLVYALEGPLDIRWLHDVFSGLTRRHDILRTRFVADSGEPVQVVDPAAGSPLRVIDARAAADPQEVARGILSEAMAQPFDLAVEHPLRAVAVRVGDADTRLTVVVHHIAADARSLEVIVRDLAGDREPPGPKARYADHAAGQRGRETAPADRFYWTERLRGLEPLALPTDRPRGPADPSRGAQVRRILPPHLAAAVTELARRQATTPYTVLLAAFHVLLGRYSGTSDVATAAFLEERPHPDFENVVGFFVETAVLRTEPAPGKTFARYLAEVHEHLLDARTHAMPFGRLVAELRPDRDRGGDPFARVSFALENAPRQSVIAGMRAVPLAPPPLPVKYDLAVTVELGDAGAELVFGYRPDLFDPATVAGWADAYERLLADVAASAERPLTDLARITEDAGGTAEVPLPVPGRTAGELVADWSVRAPGAVALTCGDRDITYRELGDAVARLTDVLCRDHGVGPETAVAVLLEPGPDLVVCLLAVLGARGVYVPLDPALPAARHAVALAEVGPAVVLTDERCRGRLPSTAAEVLEVRPFQQAGPGSLSGPAAPESLGYVTFTSGSTGRPKALAMTHRGLSNYLAYVRDVSAIGPGDAVLQLISPGFDASLRELLGALTAGARVVLPSPDRERTPATLIRIAAEHGVTKILAVVPTLLEALVHAAGEDGVVLPAVTDVLVSGEVLTRTLVQAVAALAPNARVVNQYGPSECTMTTTYTVVSRDGGEEVPIGRPIGNMRCYLLDPLLRPVPPGVEGDIYIAGPGLARGYLGAPALTAASLVADPFGPRGERMYRTGDRAIRGADGDLRFVGRADRQVKVRGVRVEPAEVEAALERHPDVRRAAVKPAAGTAGLAAFYLPQGGTEIPAPRLREHLRGLLPPAAIPDLLIPVDTFPVTRTGKIDYSALSDSSVVRARSSGPRDRLELDMIRTLSDLLGDRAVGIDDDFFAVGGNSLLAVQLVDRLRRTLGRDVPLPLVFAEPTIRGMCAVLRARQDGPAPDGPTLLRRGAGAPLFLIHPQSGDVCCYFDLARALDDRDVYGLEGVGLTGDRAPLESVAEIAAHCLAQIQAIAPHGPYRLAGWSFGGNVAVEITRLLEGGAEDVAFLGVVDARVFGSDELDPGYLSRSELGRYALIAQAGDIDGLAEHDALTVLARHAVETDRVPELGSLATVRAMVAVFTANGRAADTYRPTGSVRADIHLFKADRVHPVVPCPPVDPVGWARRTRGEMRLAMVPGDHHDLLRPPHVSGLADAMARALAEAESRR